MSRAWPAREWCGYHDFFRLPRLPICQPSLVTGRQAPRDHSMSNLVMQVSVARRPSICSSHSTALAPFSPWANSRISTAFLHLPPTGIWPKLGAQCTIQGCVLPLARLSLSCHAHAVQEATFQDTCYHIPLLGDKQVALLSTHGVLGCWRWKASSNKALMQTIDRLKVEHTLLRPLV